MKQEMMWWQWRQLDHMQIICTSLQTGSHASTSSLNICSPDALETPSQWCQSTEDSFSVYQQLHIGNLLFLYVILSKTILMCLQAHQSNRVCNALALLQCVASHPETRSAFLQGTETLSFPLQFACTHAHTTTILTAVFRFTWISQ